MGDYAQLKRALSRTPYLVAGDDGVKLVDPPTALELMAAAGPFPTETILDVGKALAGFARLPDVGKADAEFGLREVAGIAGMDYHLAYHYVRRGVFVPSVRGFGGSGRGDGEARFSWHDAFLAGMVGSLRRHGIKMNVLKKVRSLFANPTRKRASQKELTSGRS